MRNWPMRNWLLALLATVGWAGEATPLPTVVVSTPQHQLLSERPVALVNGEPVTLGDLELALLRTEGATLVKERCEKAVTDCEWLTRSDAQPILAWNPTRGQFIIELLLSKGGEVRKDLMDLKMVEQALRAEGLRIDQRLIESELARMQKLLNQGMERRGGTRTDIRTIIQTRFNMSLERFIQQRFFSIQVGVHALLEHRGAARITDAEVAQWVALQPERYQHPAAVDLSVLFLPLPGTSTDPELIKQDRENVLSIARNLKASIIAGKMTFETAWNRLSATRNDPNAPPAGHLGWVRHDGRKDQDTSSVRAVSPRAMTEAFAAQPPWPTLLDPIPADNGVELVLIHGRRESRSLTPEDLAAKARQDIIESELDKRSKQLLWELGREAKKEYVSLADLITLRARELGLKPPANDKR